MTDIEFVWGHLVPIRTGRRAADLIAGWCAERAVTRPLLVLDRRLADRPIGDAVVHGIEAAGVAVSPFARCDGAVLATVADAVSAYHFESCDAVVAVGGPEPMEVAKATALMVGQTVPLSALAGSGGPGAVDDAAIAPFLAVPDTAEAALRVGAAVRIVDEAGVPREVRRPQLRADQAVLASDLLAAVPQAVGRRSAAMACLLLIDAGEGPGLSPVGDRVRTLLAAADASDAAETVAAALAQAPAFEAGGGPLVGLAAAIAASGGDFEAALAGLSRVLLSVTDPRQLEAIAALWPELPAAPSPALDDRLLRPVLAGCDGTGRRQEMEGALHALGVQAPAAARRAGGRRRA